MLKRKSEKAKRIVVVAVVEEAQLVTKKESFSDFIKRIREKYSKLLKTDKVTLIVV